MKKLFWILLFLFTISFVFSDISYNPNKPIKNLTRETLLQIKAKLARTGNLTQFEKDALQEGASHTYVAKSIKGRSSTNVSPNSSNYWTGTTDGSSKTETSLVIAHNDKDGWMNFNISGIPVGSTINSVEFHGYIYDNVYPYWSITALYTEPVAGDAATLQAAIDGETDGTYNYFQESGDLPNDWRVETLGGTANADLQNAIANGWFAVGINSTDNVTDYYINFQGWNEANPPYLVVNYTEPVDPPDISITPSSFDVYIESGDSLTESMIISNSGIGDLNWAQNTSRDFSPTTVFEDGFEDGTLSPFTFSNTGNVRGLILSSSPSPHSGNYSFRMDTSPTGSQDYGRLDLPIDLSSYDKNYLNLTFWYYNSGCENDDEVLKFSNNNGATWSTISLLSPPTGWQEVSIDFSSFAGALTSNFIIRWEYHDNYDWSADGLAIDDVKIVDSSVDLFTLNPTSGNIAPSASQNVDVTFYAITLLNGVYQDTIRIDSNDPDEATVEIPVTVNVGEPPIADFTYSDSSGFIPLTVNFTDTSTGSSATSWQWDIDNDGIVDYTTQSCSHTYNSVGTYSVKLTVSNNWGTDNIVKTNIITVSNPPDISVNPTSFSVNIGEDSTIDDTLTIYNSGLGDLNWSYESSSTRSNPKVLIVHTTADANPFKTAMVNTGLFTSSDIDILSNPASISLSTLTPYDAVIVWSNDAFSDPQNIGDTLKEYVDAGGGVIIATYTLSSTWAIQGDILDANYSPFLPASTTSVSGTINYSAIANPSHPIFSGISTNLTYWTNNNYSNPPLNTGGSLLAYDTSGNRVIAENQDGNVMGIVIYPANVNDSACNDATRRMFANALHYVAKGSFVSANPENGTVASGTSQDVILTFDSSGYNPGTYNNTITIYSNDPNTPEVEIPTTMIVSSASPVANFSADATNGANPFTVNFTDTSTGTPASWQWDIDNDGTVDYTTQNCSHTYTTAGTYTVTLTVSNLYGTDSETKIGYITVANGAPYVQNPIADFNFDEDTVNTEIDLTDVFADPDNDALNYSYSGNVHITVRIINGLVTLTPETNWNGTETLIFTATESSLLSKRNEQSNRAAISDTVLVTVNSINDEPTVVNPQDDIIIAKNGDYTTVNLNNVFDDIDSFLPLTAFSIDANNHISYVVNADTTITLTPDANWTGSEQLHFVATDDSSAFAIDFVNVIVYNHVSATEDFDHSGNLPSNWSASNWNAVLDAGTDYRMTATNAFMETSDDKLMSETYNLTNYINLTASFFSNLTFADNTQALFQISTNGGIVWQTVDSYTTTEDSTYTYDLSDIIDEESNVVFRWHFIADTYESSWDIDDFVLTADEKDVSAPSNINDLSITSNTPNSISLSWTPTVEDYFSTYEIYYSTDSNVTIADSLWDYTDDANLTIISTNTTTVTGLATDTEYWLAIRAINSSGNASNLSNVVSVICSELPSSQDAYPDPTNLPFLTSKTAQIGITFTDDTMLDASSIQYRIDANGNGIYDGGENWTDVTHVRYTDSDSIEVRETVTYNVDGDTLRYEFRAKDTIGNNYAYTGTSQSEGITDDYYVRIDSTEPSVINDFSINSATATSVFINWSAVTETHFEEYKIYYNTHENITTADSLWDSTDDNNLSDISTTSTTITGLSSNDTYWFRIAAIDTYGNESNLSNEIASIPNNILPVCQNPYPTNQPTPDFFTSQTVTIGCEFVDFYGTDSTTVQYRIDANGNGTYDAEETWQNYVTTALTSKNSISTMPMLSRNIASSDTFVVRVNVTFDVDGDSLHFEFRAKDVDGYGYTYSGLSSVEGISDDWVVKIDATQPDPIGVFATGAVTDSSVVLGWGVSNDTHFAGYEVYYGTHSGITLSDSLWDKTNDAGLSEIGTTYMFTTVNVLSPATTYYFRVRAVDEAGNACSLSEEKSATTESNYPPASPQNLQTTISGNNLILTWNAVTQNTNGDSITVSEYKIYTSDDPYWGAGAATNEYTTSDTTYTHTNVLNSVDKLFYKVSAIKSASKKKINLLNIFKDQKANPLNNINK